jgi:hypothetical protein
MAKIQVYQQGKLASSLVGTPGVDPSGRIAAEAALGQVGSQIQNQDALNSTLTQATNAMRGQAFQTNETINKAQLAGRQTQIENEQAGMMSQVDLYNRERSLQGQNLESAVSGFAQSMMVDRRAQEERQLRAQNKADEAQRQIQNLQDVLMAKEAINPGMAQLRQYANSIQQQIQTGQINGNDAGKMYTDGIGSIMENITSSLPANLSQSARLRAVTMLTDATDNQAGLVTEAGFKLGNQVAKDTATTNLTNIVKDSGQKVQYTWDGSPLAPTSNEALTLTMSRINEQGKYLTAYMTPNAAATLVGKNKVDAFGGWGQSIINNAKTNSDMDLLRSYLKPDASGQAFIQKLAPLTSDDIKEFDAKIQTRSTQIETAQNLVASHAELQMNAVTLKYLDQSENAGIEDSGMARQTSIKNKAEAELSALQKNPPAPNDDQAMKVWDKQSQGWLKVAHTAQQAIKDNNSLKEHKAEQARIAVAGERSAAALERQAITAQNAYVEKKARDAGVSYEEQVHANHDEGEPIRAGIAARLNVYNKMHSSMKTVTSTADDFKTLNGIYHDMAKAKEEGYYMDRPGHTDPAFEAHHGSLLASIDQVHRASTIPKGMFQTGLTDQATATASENLYHEMVSGADPVLHITRDTKSNPQIKAKTDNDANARFQTDVNTLKKMGKPDEWFTPQRISSMKNRIAKEMLTGK